MGTIAVQLLGRFSVVVDGCIVPDTAWRRRKAAAVVKLLALAPGHRLHRDQVIELLWPETASEPGLNALHQTLHVARGALDPERRTPGRYLRLQDQVLQLATDLDVTVDVLAFEAAAAAARRQHDIASYLSALRQYHGDLLPDDRYEEWAAARREQLRQMHQGLLQELGQLYESRGQTADAIEIARRLLASDPLDEQVHRTLMRLYAASGQRKQALQQFQQLRATLARELEIEPEQESVQLYQQVLAGKIGAVPPAPTSAADDVSPLPSVPQTNLPAPVTRFVGRAREQTELAELLASTRLLTLTGPGGAGKTRLAYEVARAALPRYAGGVWTVELAALTDGRLAPYAVAAALGVREMPGLDLTSAIVGTLRSRELLLVLDNCEHLIEDAARLADMLLRDCAGITILATSREPLQIQGERVWPVPPLAVPAGDDADGADALAGSEAVELFVERARAVQPDFRLADDNAALVVELCRRLDGLPLALELAAARVRTLGLQQIVRRLEDRFHLLTGGSRVGDTRQQTLQAALDWSYGLLSGPERELFARLAVFAGVFDLEAAEAIAVGGTLTRVDVVDQLGQLVQRSLVTSSHTGGTVRYGMLETMRAYALDRARDASVAESAREEHARYYARLATEANQRLRGGSAALWLHRLTLEHDNLRAALAWHAERAASGDPEPGLELVGRLHWFWQLGGHFSEGRAWQERLLSHTHPTPTPGRAWALTGSGILALAVGEYGVAGARLDAAIDAWVTVGDPGGMGLAVTWSGWIALFHGDLAGAVDRYQTGLSRFQEAGDRWGVALATLGLGFAASESDDHAIARARFEQSLAIFQSLDDAWGIATTRQQLAFLSYRSGAFADARAGTLAVLERARQMGDRWLEIQSRSLLGEIARAEGDLATATEAAEASLALARQLGHRVMVFWSLRDAGHVALARGDAAAAGQLFREGYALAQERGYQLGMACGVAGLAGVTAATDAELAAILLGATHAALDRLRLALAPADRSAAERLAEKLRDTLGDSTFEAALTSGGALALDDAVARYDQFAT